MQAPVQTGFNQSQLQSRYIFISPRIGFDFLAAQYATEVDHVCVCAFVCL